MMKNQYSLFLKQGNNPSSGGSTNAEREQKMLDASMENLSQRLADLRGSISSMITKIETDPTLNWPSFLNSLALIRHVQIFKHNF